MYVAGPVYPALPGQSGAGYDDIFLRKYGFDRQVMWTRQFGSTDADIVSGLATDGTGIYAAGSTFGTLPGQVSAGGFDAYVRKYSANGAVIWTHQFGTSQDDGLVDGGGGVGDGGTAIASHSSGLYVTGWTAGTFPGEPAGSGQDFFVANLDPQSGHVLWLRQFGVRGVPSNMNAGIGVDDTGIYVATNHFPTDPSVPIFLLRKYDFEGNLIWAQQHDNGSDRCIAYIWNLAVHAGRVYVVSQESQGFVIDVPESCQQGPDTTVVVGGLRAYDSDGNLIWTRKIEGENRRGGDDFTGAKTVWASEAGVFVAANLEGSFPGHVPAHPRSDHARCRGAEQGSPFADKLGDDARGVISLDAYVRRYNFNGDVIWTHQFGSSAFVAGLGTDATGVYAAGGTRGAIAPGQAYSGCLEDAFIIRFALEPTSPSGLVQLIVGQIETLSDRQRLEPGEFNALIQHLEAALGALKREKRSAARQALESFVREVKALARRGTLSASESEALITAANGVIATL